MIHTSILRPSQLEKKQGYNPEISLQSVARGPNMQQVFGAFFFSTGLRASLTPWCDGHELSSTRRSCFPAIAPDFFSTKNTRFHITSIGLGSRIWRLCYSPLALRCYLLLCPWRRPSCDAIPASGPSRVCGAQPKRSIGVARESDDVWWWSLG